MPHSKRAAPAPILKQNLPPAAMVAPTQPIGYASPPLGSQDAAALPFSACTSSIHSTRVSFPPTPKLTSNRLTYPAQAYDRSPIVVAPNECAMPARGSRATAVAGPSTPRASRSRSPRSYHTSQQPDSYFAANAPSAPATSGHIPPLTWSGSSSSESDESDGPFTPPMPDAATTPRAARFNALGLTPSNGVHDSALAFLPHPPSPEREKKRRSATPAARTRRTSPPSSFSITADDGCLGGF
jgi:hypothetical protein